MANNAARKISPQSVAEVREETRQKIIGLGGDISVPFTTVSAHWLYEGEQRMDASYFADKVFAAQRVVDDCHLPIYALADPNLVDEVFIQGRFRRVYTNDKKRGWPYLSASDALLFRPVSNRYIERDHAPKPSEKYFVKDGWILVSCSGTVGRAVIATKRMEQYFLTHDLARIVPSSSVFALLPFSQATFMLTYHHGLVKL